MFKRLALALSVSASTACVAKLDLPAGARIACASDSDCSGGLVCGAAIGLCADPALRDGVGPRLQSATATSATSVTLVFDERVVLRDDALASVALEPGLVVIAFELDPNDPSRAVLLTAPQRGQQPYVVTVSNVTDIFDAPISEDAKSFGFNGFGPGPDESPPSFVSPIDGQQAPLGALTVLWSGLSLVEFYVVEVWTSDPSAGGSPAATYTVAAPTTSVEVTLGAATTHWLRLRSDATREGEYAVRRVEAIGDTLYVSCPAGMACDDSATGGNLSNPRRSIARALVDARRLGASRVLVAARGGAEAYTETLDVFAKLTLRGGYDATFAESAWAPATNKTIVRTLDATVLGCSAVRASENGAVLIEGFELISASPNPSTVLNFRNCDDGVEVRGNVIRNEGTAESRTGILLESAEPTGAPGPRIIDNEIHAGLGIQVLGIDTLIHGNTIRAGDIPEAGGVFVTGGEVEISNNTIDVTVGDASSGGWVAIYVLQFNPFDGRVNVRSNTITVGAAPRASDGVIFQNGDGEISGNTITTSASGFTVGVLLESSERIGESRDWRVSHNVFDIGAGTETAAAIYIGDRGDRAVGRISSNRGTVAGLGSAGSNIASGVFIGSEGAQSPSTRLFFENNAFEVGATPLATSVGAYVSLLGARPKLTWVHNTFVYTSPSRTVFPARPTSAGMLVDGAPANLGMTLVNNLFVGPSNMSGGPAIYSSESAPAPIMDNNLAAGVERFLWYPNASVDDVSGALANTSWGDDNLRLTADAALDGLAPTPASPVEIRFGGVVSLAMASCGGGNADCCGWIDPEGACVGVGTDALETARTCPVPVSQCTSIGAFESD